MAWEPFLVPGGCAKTMLFQDHVPSWEKKPEGVILDTTVDRTVFLADDLWDLSALQSVVRGTDSSSLRVPGPPGSLSVNWLGLSNTGG